MGDSNQALGLTATQSSDLGLSGKLAERSGGRRMMNPDGTFNVQRTGSHALNPINLYHTLLSVSWLVFFVLAISAYVLVNAAFAGLYLLGGPGALDGVRTDTLQHHVLDCFFFSVQTLATIGYGKITPASGWANFLVAIEALAGLLGFAFITGLLFARFSRPVAKLAYSNTAVIAPYQGRTGFMFRLANRRANELSEVTATLSLARWETEAGQRKRKFHVLQLERKSVVFLPWQWVVVHPIDETSPLWGVTEAEFIASQPELFILITAMDETFSQVVHSRTSYVADEVVWNAKFKSMLDDESAFVVNLDRINDIERL